MPKHSENITRLEESMDFARRIVSLCESPHWNTARKEQIADLARAIHRSNQNVQVSLKKDL